MRAVVFEQVGKVRVAEVPDAVIEEPDDAIVRVTRSAICGSDLHFYHGKAPMMTGEGIDDERALFVGDVLTTGFYGASLGAIRPEETVAVIGCGPVGFFCIQAAVALGSGRVYALDLDPRRLALAERAGAVPIDVRRR